MPVIFVNPSAREIKQELKEIHQGEKDLGLKPEHEVAKKPLAKIHKIKGHTHHPLSTFFYFPDGVRFIAQDAQERIVLLLRKHFITNVGWILIALIMLFAPGILSFFPILDFLPERFQLVAVLGWYLLTTAYIFESFLSWFFNVYIVTDERIFDVDFVNLVYREIAEANIDQIQDVNVKLGSVIRTVFNYGDIYIQTASAVPNIEFEAVPQPDKVALILRELRVEEEQEKVEGRVR